MPIIKVKPIILNKILVLLELLFLSFCIATTYADNDLLTKEEREWLQKHGPIKYGPDPDFFPFEFLFTTGQAQGITPDILNLISKKLNIEIITIRCRTWSDVIDGIKRGDIDLLGTLTWTEERERYLKFTTPYINVPVVLFVHEKNPQFADIKNLTGRKVGVVKDYGAEYWLRKNHPKLVIIPTTTTREGLWMVESEQIDAFVEVLQVGVGVAAQNAYFSIRHSTEPLYTTPQHFAVIKTNDILHSIIEKGIASISESEKQEIISRWAKEMPVEKSAALKIIVILLVVITILLIVLWLTVFLLRKIIRKRTEELRRSENFFKNLFQNNPLPGGIVELESGKIVEVNKKLVEVYGYTEEELKGRTAFELGLWIKPEERGEFINLLRKRKIIKGFEHQFMIKGGRILDVILHAQVFEMEGKEIILYLVEDITEKKKIERMQKRLVDIVESSDGFVLTTDVNLNVFYMNPAAQRTLNVNINGKILDIFPNDEKGRLTNEIIQSAVENGLWKGELQIKGKNGEPIPSLTIAIAHRKPDNTIDYYSFIFRDITELKKTYQALKESEERLRQIIENSTQVFYIHDADRKFVYVSPQIKTLLGFDVDEVLGRFTFEFLSDNPINRIGSELTELALRTGERQRPYECELIAKDGRKVWVEIYESPIVQHGKTVAMVGSLKDITKRKQAEMRLKEREAFLDAITKYSPDVIVIFDLIRRDVIYANKEIAELLGYEKMTVKNFQEFSKLLHEEDRQKLNQHFLKLMNGEDGVVYECEYRIKNASGDYRWFYARDTIFKRDENGNVVQILSAQRDITREKKLAIEKEEAEAQKIHSNKMQALGELASGVAHDINNDLTVILGNLSLLKGNREPTDEEWKYLERAAEAAEKIRDLSKQLLVFSRKEAMKIRPINVSEAITGAIKLLRNVKMENVKIELEFAPNLPLINADRSMIQTAIINLVTNACDAMPRGGNIKITTSIINIEQDMTLKNPEAKKGKYIMVKVADTGTGIPKEIMDKIFDPFFTTKPVGKGTGMGLSTVHGVVKNHGGWVDVESEVGKGTTFTLYFPVPDKLVEVPTQIVPQELESATVKLLRGNETILIVEDNPSVRDTMASSMRTLGYNVLLAADGQSALNLVQRYNQKIDLLFTDVILTGRMNGIELYEKLKEYRPDIKVLFTSGHSGDYAQIMADLMEQGIFLPKPFDLCELSKKLRECLEQN